MEIVLVGPEDDAAVLAAERLFDGPARTDQIRRFLQEPGHHLLLAYEGGEPVGFASGIEVVHPDKQPEMMLYEIAVDDARHRTGIGRALVGRIHELAREKGCVSVFVFADADDDRAQRFYEALAPRRRDESVMYTWE